MRNYKLSDEVIEYNSALEKTNAPAGTLVAPSQNVLISRNRKVSSRRGFTRLGAANTALTDVRNAWTWFTSTGTELAQRFYDDELEVYLGTIDTVALNAWHRVRDGWSTTEKLRATAWWDNGENIDEEILVNGTSSAYEWSGAVAVIASVGTNTLTKKGTNTWAQSRAYTTGNKVFINVRTGVEFTYTGGETTTTLTSVTPDPAVADIVENDVFIQKMVTTANIISSTRNNHNVHVFENQVCFGSEDDNEVHITDSDDYTDFTASSPRVPTDPAVMTLDGPSKGIVTLGSNLIFFAGESGVFKALYTQITVGSTLSETLTARKLNTGHKQGSFSPDTVVAVGNSLIYLSNEPAVRYVQTPEDLEGTDPKTLSNPIKPTFDAEDFTNASAIWFKNAFHLTSPVNSNLYILEFVEDADGKLRRFWQPPQILPIGALSVITNKLHGHSNTIPETYELFAEDVYSDINSSDEKIPIHAIAAFAYNSYGRRMNLKTFDEYATIGEISPATTITLTLNYDFGGHTQSVEKEIAGTDSDILLDTVLNAALAQQPLAQQPLGGALEAPIDAAQFNIIHEIAPEEFHMIQPVYSTNAEDFFFSIIAWGANARLSPRQDTQIKK